MLDALPLKPHWAQPSWVQKSAERRQGRLTFGYAKDRMRPGGGPQRPKQQSFHRVALNNSISLYPFPGVTSLLAEVEILKPVKL